MIPKTNVKNLMIKDEIIEAVEKGLFHIYAIENVSEGLQVLTGLTMYEIDDRVRERLEKSSENDRKDREDNEDKKDDEDNENNENNQSI